MGRKRTNLLINEEPLQVIPSLAKAVGLAEAVALQQVHYWMGKNMGRIVDGERWIYNSYGDWQRDNFPFWTVKVVGNVFRALEDKGLLKSRQDLNRSGSDRSKWYTIDYEALARLEAGIEEEALESSQCPDLDIDDPKAVHSMIPILDIDDPKMGHSSIAENTSETTTEKLAPAKADASVPDKKKVNGRLHWQIAKLSTAFFKAKGVVPSAISGQARGQTNNVLKNLPAQFTEDDVYRFVKYLESDPWWREPGRITPSVVVARLPEWAAKGRPEALVPDKRRWEAGKIGASEMGALLKEMDSSK